MGHITSLNGTIQINSKFFKVSAESVKEIELLVSTLYGGCCQYFLDELNTLLGKIFWNNPSSAKVDDLVNFEYIV